MKSNIRKIGNSIGTILPAPILKKLHLSEGDEIEVSVDGNTIIISSPTTKPKYTLSELLKQCDLNAPLPIELEKWNDITPIGKESL